jgi:RNA polymerase sigma-70 factor (ECF subfamily)
LAHPLESSEGQPGDRNSQGASFSEEVIPHMDAVYRFALRLSGTGDEAEDLVQDTYLHAFRAWE